MQHGSWKEREVLAEVGDLVRMMRGEYSHQEATIGLVVEVLNDGEQVKIRWADAEGLWREPRKWLEVISHATR